MNELFIVIDVWCGASVNVVVEVKIILADVYVQYLDIGNDIW